ncbi:GntR family transcriptional regulator [Terriglobus sp. TAA 43]|uniref:GntR family transcriptional regulator n=1 Tax=Terriglobus sp. TAA 43 TaxID=278961 RepID=UPI0006481572|nr:GntR family transcriptional regulator [Terriglobus sp. TAA 43]
MTPFRVRLQPGQPIHEQVVYAATRAIVAGQLRPGDLFPSVRALSRDLSINPNTAHKVISQLIADGLLQAVPGIGTVVAEPPRSTASQRTELLGKQMEELAVEAKRLSIPLGDLTAALEKHWSRLFPGDAE